MRGEIELRGERTKGRAGAAAWITAACAVAGLTATHAPGATLADTAPAPTTATASPARAAIAPAAALRSSAAMAAVAPAAPPGSFAPPMHPGSPACEPPISWRIDGVDPAFGLTPEEAADAARDAAELWNDAAGRPLFLHDPDDGFPIRFEHDERHARIQERARRQVELAEQGRRIAADRAQLDELRDRLARDRAAHEERADALQARLRAYRDEVDAWNRRGGAPPDEVARLEQVERDLELERRVVNLEGESLNELVERVNARAAQLNRAVDEHNAANAAFRDAFPPESVQSGHYRESRRTLGPWTFSVQREISVFQFDDRNHLVLVLAHELGHALGLGHSGETEAVMYVHAGARRPAGSGVRLHPRDVDELRRVCGERQGSR